MSTDLDLRAEARSEHSSGRLEHRVPSWVRRISAYSWTFVGGSIAVAIVIGALGTLRELIIPLVLAAFLAVVFSPCVDWLGRFRVPRPVGAVLILFLILMIVAVSIGAVVLGVIDQADSLQARFDDVATEVENLLSRSDVSTLVSDVLSGAESSGGVVSEGIGSSFGSLVGSASGFFTGLILAAVLLYYLLKDGPSLVNGFASSQEPDRAQSLIRILAESASSVRSYVRGRTILAVVQAAAIGVIAAIAGVPLAFTIGLVNLIGAYIPYIGGLVGGAFAVLMALSVGGIGLALLMLVVVLVVSVGLENVLEPKLLADKLEMHPVVVLFATVSGGLLLGLTGMFLAAPVAAIARTLWKELQSSGFFDDDMSGRQTSASALTRGDLDASGDPTPLLD